MLLRPEFARERAALALEWAMRTYSLSAFAEQLAGYYRLDLVEQEVGD